MDVDQKIVDATLSVGKTYVFDEGHDSGRPADWWFQESDEGLILFLVYYTQACRWSLCTGCNLPSVGSQHPVSWRNIVEQTAWVLGHERVAPRLAEVAKVIVSNNGSVLDEVTFPTTALLHLIVQLNLALPKMSSLCLETRPEYVDLEELLFLSRAMGEREQPATIELAIGFEAFDDHVRNQVFKKGLSLEGFEQLVSRISEPHFRLKCYFMQKPVPGMSDQEAVQDIQRGIEYLDEMSKKYQVSINMHLNPTYVAHGTPLAESFAQGEYSPPLLLDVARAALAARGTGVSIYIGLNDEGLAVAGGSFLRPGDEALAAQLEQFNRTQDFELLRSATTAEQ